MAASLRALLLPALCSLPAMASRAAVASHMEASTVSATPCTCLFEWTDGENLEHLDLHMQKKYESLEECASECPMKCNRIKYRFSPEEAEELDPATRISVPLTLAKCNKEGRCKCLKKSETLDRVKRLKEKGQHGDFAEIKKIYGSPKECLERCKCNKKARSSPEFDYEGYKGLCMNNWRWRWYLYYKQRCADAPVFGLVNCFAKQQFKLRGKRGGLSYTAELEKLIQSEKKSIDNINLQVMKLEANEDTAKIEVGTEGAERTWTAENMDVSSRWSWSVKYGEEGLRVFFTVRKEGERYWKVYNGTRRGEKELYHVHGKKKANPYEKGFKFHFYKDAAESKGWLEYQGHDQDKDQEEYIVTALKYEDAGIILLTSMLIDKAYNAERR